MTLQRRSFIRMAASWVTLSAGTAAGQRKHKLPRVALVFSTIPAVEMAGADPPHRYARAFVHALRDLGLVEGRDIVIERRSAEGRPERVPELMRELVEIGVDVIVTTGANVLAAQRATGRIALVGLVDGVDALDLGLVESLARPGRNLTGIGLHGSAIVGKRLQLLKEAAPAISRVAVIGGRPRAGPRASWRAELDAAARAMQLDLRWHGVDAPEEFEPAFAAIVREPSNALFVAGTNVNYGQRFRIAEFAAAHRLPSIGAARQDAEAGLLLSYGADFAAGFRRAAELVKRILDGAKPGDLPFEQPTRFELVINMKTAKAIGLTIPQSLLLRADEVIE